MGARGLQSRFGRGLIAVVLATLALLCAAPAARAGYAAIVLDHNTGQVLDEVNADQINHPASLTKMMTLYLAFEALQKGKLRWDQPLHVSTWAASRAPTKLGLEPGDSVSVHDCVLGMIVLSANDAATVVAEALGGSEEGFARLMTEKAHALGMGSTNFVNASGLPDEDQVTTARDLVRLAVALHDDFPEQYRFFATREFTFRGRIIVGHNRLMYRYAGMDGLKTGYTASSGFNLASSAERGGRRLFAVVLGSESAPMRDRLMAKLLDDSFADRTTDPVLVAQAAGQPAPVARRILAGAATVVAALSPVGRAEAATAPPRAAFVRPAVSSAAERWGVQVGTSAREAQAETLAARDARIAGISPRLAEVVPADGGERIYRARLVDFASKRDAEAACGRLEHKGEKCFLVPPDAGHLRLAGSRPD